MLKYNVHGQRLRAVNSDLVASDTINYLTATFDFSNEWKDYTKWIVFKQEETGSHAEVLLTVDDTVTEDSALNLSEGEWIVYVYGEMYADGEVVKRVTTDGIKLRVRNSAFVGSIDFEYNLDAGDQVIAQVTTARNEAIAAMQEAKNEAVATLEAYIVEKTDGTLDEMKEDIENEILKSMQATAQAIAAKESIEEYMPTLENAFSTVDTKVAQAQQAINELNSKSRDIDNKLDEADEVYDKMEHAIVNMNSASDAARQGALEANTAAANANYAIDRANDVIGKTYEALDDVEESLERLEVAIDDSYSAVADMHDEIDEAITDATNVMENARQEASNAALDAIRAAERADLVVGKVGEVADKAEELLDSAEEIRDKNESLYNEVKEAYESGELNGKDGEDGITPVRGVDYWNTEDIDTIDQHIEDEVAGLVEVKEGNTYEVPTVQEMQNAVSGLATKEEVEELSDNVSHHLTNLGESVNQHENRIETLEKVWDVYADSADGNKAVPTGAVQAEVLSFGGAVESVTTVGMNIVPTDGWVNGLLTDDGTVVPNSNRVSSRMIACKGNTRYVFGFKNETTSSVGVGRIAEYDLNRHLVKYDNDNPRSDDAYITQSNTRYIVLCLNTRYGAEYNNDCFMVEYATLKNETTFVPYIGKTVNIPEAVRNLDGYGTNGTSVSKDDSGKWWFVNGDNRTDITDLMGDSLNWMPVEGGGSISFDNAAGLSVPNTVQYRCKPKHTDVQINGTSITENGVANLILATKLNGGIVYNQSTGLGLKCGDGIGVNANGYLYAARANESMIDARTGDAKNIDAPHLNYAVKAALTDANKMVLTDTEKAAACQTIGAERVFGFDKVLDITTTEDADALRVSFEHKLSEMMIAYQTVADETASNSSVDLFATQDGANGGTVNSRIAYRVFHSKAVMTHCVSAKVIGDRLPTFAMSANVSAPMYNTWYSGAPALTISNDPRGTFAAVGGFSGLYGNFKVPTGTRIIVYGVKA